jgi:hypothetical protein
MTTKPSTCADTITTSRIQKGMYNYSGGWPALVSVEFTYSSPNAKMGTTSTLTNIGPHVRGLRNMYRANALASRRG